MQVMGEARLAMPTTCWTIGRKRIPLVLIIVSPIPFSIQIINYLNVL